MSPKLRQAFAALGAYNALVEAGARVWPNRDGLFMTDDTYGPAPGPCSTRRTP